MLASAALLLCVAIIAAVPVFAFYPGIMNADSLALYAGAVIPGPVMDWHSPALTWVLRLLIRSGGGVAAFVAMQSAIYVFALYGVLSRIRIGAVARIGILILVVFAPPTMPWIATAEKTAFMTAILGACFLCSLCLDAGRWRAPLVVAILVLSVIGTWCRPNGIIIFLPVVAFTAWQSFRISRSVAQRRPGADFLSSPGSARSSANSPSQPVRTDRGEGLGSGMSRELPWARALGDRPRQRQTASTAIASAVLVPAFLLLALGGPALGVQAGAVVKTYPQQATMDLDLLNLSLRTGQSLIPPDILAAPFAEVKAAMAPDPFVLGPLDTSLRRITEAADMRRLQSAWLSAIRDHPRTYLHYRLDLYREYLCFDLSTICLGSWHWYTGGIDPNPFGLASHKIPAVFAFYKALAGSVVFHPFFDVFAMAAVLLGAMLGRRRVVGAYAAILLLFDLSNALLIPGVTVRMVVPLGLMLPFLIAGLYAEGTPPRWGEVVRANAR